MKTEMLNKELEVIEEAINRKWKLENELREKILQNFLELSRFHSETMKDIDLLTETQIKIRIALQDNSENTSKPLMTKEQILLHPERLKKSKAYQDNAENTNQVNEQGSKNEI